MNDRADTRIEQLHQSIEDLEQRVAALERLIRSGAVLTEPGAHPDDLLAEEEGPSTGHAAPLVGLIGRTLLVLAGAFLLRAMTDTEVLAPALGTALGLVYAMIWAALAARAAARGGRGSASFHLLSASLIGFPLLAEATTKYGVFSPVASAAGVAGVSGAFLLVAWLRSLRGAAWIVTVAGVATTIGLAAVSTPWIPFGYTLLALSVFTLGLHYTRNWYFLAWGVGLALSLVLVITLVLAVLPDMRESAGGLSLVWFLLAVVLVYVLVFGVRTLVGGRSVKAFEILQSTGVILVGLLGAVLVSRSGGGSALIPAALSLALAVGAYAVAFSFVDRREDRKTNFLYYTTLALPLTFIATAVFLSEASFVYLCAALAVLAAWLGGRFSRVTLNIHGAAYAVGAALVSGLLATSSRSFLESPRLSDWGAATLLVPLAALACCAWISAATHGRTWGRFARAPKLVVLAALIWGSGGLVVALIAGLLPWTREPDVDLGALATLRTGVLAGAALLLGAMARMGRLYEARWLVYPVLVLGGVKLLADDFPHGRPTTLFLSLALLGAALILAPRLTRRAAPTG